MNANITSYSLLEYHYCATIILTAAV